MASSTYKIGQKFRFVRGNKDWIGAEMVLVTMNRNHNDFRLTKSTPTLESASWGYHAGSVVHLPFDYLERCDGLLDI